ALDGPVETPAAWPAAPRPIRLLAPPEPIEAVAPVPDDPPAMFRWRRVRRRVVRAEGPERIAPEWWLRPGSEDACALRDYYRVEDQDGRRYWLFREGLYRPGAPPAWFIHGLFA
ncbi:MAG: DNA polymerase Y family protein, partial [Defluviicoccus sp.]|nr:DNA polymerase Y family protein [Defluviicoccus sp.]